MKKLINSPVIDQLVSKYNICKTADLRSTINCPCCGTSLIKNYQRTVFCSSVCKDFYWNQVRSVNKKDYSEKMKQIFNYNNQNTATSCKNDSLLVEFDKKAKSYGVEVHQEQYKKLSGCSGCMYCVDEYTCYRDCNDESDYWD